MITKTELEQLWSAIIPQAGQTVGRRADSAHPLDFFITYDESPNMQFMLLAEFQPALPKSSEQIYVRGNQREDGKYAICFSLADTSLTDQYISLCWDIMECTYHEKNNRQGIQSAIKRFILWQRLFAERHEKKLSETEIKGLIGELNILKKICIPKYGADSAISGWMGPTGSDRDFEYADAWYESKYLSLSMDKVQISSLDQLDTDAPGFLAISRAEKASPEAGNAITLNEIIDDILCMIGKDENTLVSFKNKLALYGYERNDDRSEQPYSIFDIELYAVNSNSFPRIRRSTVHNAVTEGNYKLSVPALSGWKVDK